MTEAVSYKSNEVEVLAFFTAKETVNCIDKNLNDVDVLPLIKASYVVGFCYFTLMENKVYCTGGVLYIEPVADILAFAIDGERFAMAYVIDEERNQFLRELVWTIVIRAVCHNCWHTVSIVEGTNEMVGTCLTCRIWRVRVVL